MSEYDQLVGEYSQEGYSMYSRTLSPSEWGLGSLAIQYLEKYWMPFAEYEGSWLGICDRVFPGVAHGLPNWIFPKDWRVLGFRGGVIFDSDRFEALKCLQGAIGESEFAVIQDGDSTHAQVKDSCLYRLVFPSVITWDEIRDGNFVSSVLLEMFHNDYLVLGRSGLWGWYAANDSDYPLCLLGVHPTLASYALECCESIPADEDAPDAWMPAQYIARRLRRPSVK